MANIDTYLQAIMEAVYGEQVRGSIHDAIALINDVSEAVLTVGTAVDSPTSSSTGFFEDSLYVNSITWDLWKCTGTDTWSLEGNIKGETGNGIASITKTSTNVLVDTYTILFTDGTHTTFDVTNGKSIVSIAKTSTSGLVDTYTITFNDTTTTTFTVTNGIDGNRWFRGTDISGKAVNPTVYVNSGITDARPNDYYLNPSEGAVYYCVTGGDASTATWSYELTMSGGGGGGNLSDLGDVSLVSLQNGQFLKYNITTSKWENANITFADLTDSNISSPTEGQVLTYNGTTGKWENRGSVSSWNGRTGAVVPVAGDYNASQVAYDNTNSGLTATTEQGAIDELAVTSDCMLNELGAKNLLPNNAKTQVVNGVTFTVNSDGSVTCSGTATATAIFSLSYHAYKAGRYIGSKFADDSFVDESQGTFNYIAYMYNVSMPTIIFSNEDKEFELPSDVENIQYALEIANGVTINKTVYPMIRPASIADNTYVPHAMTNGELTRQFVVELVSYGGSTTVTSNGIVDRDINASKTGYTAIGVVGHRINGVIGLVAASISVTSGTNVRMRLYNPTSASLTAASLEVYVLYSKV